MVKIKINLYVLIAFIVLFFAIVSAYFLVSMELANMTTTTLPKTNTILTTTSPTTTTTLPAPLGEGLLGLANKNIRDKCNVTYTNIERKHFPTSKWFSDLCPNFKDYNETEMWRADAYLNGECNLEEENRCIEIFTSISLDEKLICVWGINHYNASKITLEDLTQKYC